tara:strand:+ start:481 stop:1155 length:675 start_codon:yes stop_codon:yes gene_type:complete
MKNLKTLKEHLGQIEDLVNEMKFSVDDYAGDIWYEYQKDILELVKKINKEFFDGQTEDIILRSLARIFQQLASPAMLKKYQKQLGESLNEKKKVEKGDRFNADGITWEVIKVGSTQSKAKAITKSAKGKEDVYDNKEILPSAIQHVKHVIETVLNEGTDLGSWNQGGPRADDNVLITRFAGPKSVESLGLGRQCIQINVGQKYVQLNPADIVELQDILKDYKVK